MDDSETIVMQFLQQQGYSNIVYEPDGNVTPDFLINGTIAIEVRRLNLNTHINGIIGGKTQLYHNLYNWLERLGSPVKKESLLLEFRCNEKVLPWPDLSRDLQHVLSVFAEKADNTQKILYKSPNAVLSYIGKTGRPQPSQFVLQSFIQLPGDAPVFQQLMAENIRYCMEEKARKTYKKRRKYEQWWLALVDHAGFDPGDMNESVMQALLPSQQREWDKLLVLDHGDPGRFMLL